MATCAVIGQGVGTAAAHAISAGILPKHLSDDTRAVTAIQQTLLRNDAFLVGIQNHDDSDIVRQATASATSQRSEGPASNVLTGQTRAVHGEGGVPLDRTTLGTHR